MVVRCRFVMKKLVKQLKITQFSMPRVILPVVGHCAATPFCFCYRDVDEGVRRVQRCCDSHSCECESQSSD